MRYLGAKKLLCVSVLAALSFSGELAAQDTTSGIRGKLIDGSGNPLVNATVTVRDTRTGNVRTLESNNTGTFYATNLAVGGPYVVTVNGTKTITVESIALGDIYNLSVDMGAPTAVEEIIVVGGLNFVDVAAGPSASFSAFDLETSVTYDRDIKDIYTIDPRFSLDGDSQVNCVGKHPRFNSISLDGISQNDRFGLNGNGYATATGQPFPYEAVAQVSAELAPFDVTYGGFTACNVNAVTKSGSNEWTGTAYFELTNDSLRGDSVTTRSGTSNLASNDFKEERYGFSLGGPIIEDTLFIFGAYEEFEEPVFLAQGFAGSNNGEVRPWLSQDDFNRIDTISSSLYNYDTGGQPGDGAQTEEKILLRLDWNINDDHSLGLIYNSYEGIQDRSSDGDPFEFEFANHFYKKSADLETWTAKLQSQWTNEFSTEIIYSTNEMIDGQNTVGPLDFGDHQIEVDGNTVYLGADDSRQANALDWESTFIRLSGQYLLGDHVLTFGYERDELSVFNQFVQHARGGEYDYFDDSEGNSAACSLLSAQGRFDDASCGLSGIDKFELARPSRVYYGSGGGTNNAADAAASYDLDLNVLYLQDEWYLSDYNLTLVGGLRYEYFDQSAAPTLNPNFTALNGGLANNANLDGVDLLMPRLGFTWEADTNLTVRGGVGLYSGGNPNVWISNAWSNDGVTNVQTEFRNFDGSRSLFNDLPLSGQGRPGFDVPQLQVDQVANTTAADGFDSNLAFIDPDYEQPAEWKYALGATYGFNNGMSVDADLLYSVQVDPAITRDVSQDITGFTTAGAAVYGFARGENNNMLTNSDEAGKAFTASIVGRQTYDWGLDWILGYAFTRATDISPMTSSTAGSNFENVATTDFNNLQPSNSNYVSPHRFTARVSYAKEFIRGHDTRITAMFYRTKGQPGTHTLDTNDLEGNRSRRVPIYIPTANDPNVIAGPGFDTAAFAQFIEQQGYTQFAGGFIPRNQNHAAWSSRLDLRIDQELPLFFGAQARAYLKIYNVLNLIDDELGVQYDAAFFSADVIDASVDGQGRLVYERFTPRDLTDVLEQRSLYEIRAGIQFEF